MIQIGSKVKVFRPGRFEFRGEVVATSPGGFVGGIRRLDMVKVRPDPDQVSTVAAPSGVDRWVEARECVEEPIMPDPPDALFPRPGRDDADALRMLSDQLEELGLDPGATLLRDVAGRIERFDETYQAITGLQRTVNATVRSIWDSLEAGPTAGDAPGRDAPAAP